MSRDLRNLEAKAAPRVRAQREREKKPRSNRTKQHKKPVTNLRQKGWP